ncbi:flagellar basal body L-ring protein FlgH [Alteromonas macleodii]|uniref:flagellar basal body L-ring protein FlgH n=1 Tax=Alteromonas macleodii TaxID=28108 RepID=UPI0031400C97
MRYLALVGLMMIGGCSSTMPQRMDIDDYEPEYLQYQEAPRQNGSIFKQNVKLNPFGEATASRVGDVITIILAENMQATKQASSSSAKSTEASIDPLSVMGGVVTTGGLGGTDLSVSMGSDNSFSGSGGASQSNNMFGTITVTVNRVLPNGNLWVKGEKWININSGEELVKFSGVVRPRDINPDNQVQSSQVADARIVYSGEGFIKESSDPGLLYKLLNNSWWPF